MRLQQVWRDCLFCVLKQEANGGAEKVSSAESEEESSSEDEDKEVSVLEMSAVLRDAEHVWRCSGVHVNPMI